MRDIGAKPAPAGAAGLPASWARSFTFGVQYRGRAEAQHGLDAIGGRDDSSYLNRLRLNTNITATSWLRAAAQVQDAQTLRYDASPQPASHTNTLDLRQAYVEFGPASGRPSVSLRIGRQELSFGAQRLIGAGDWNNTARSFDGAKVSIVAPGLTLHGFAAAVVRIEQGRFDRPRRDEALFGVFGALDPLKAGVLLEPYTIVKVVDAVVSETGRAGNGRIISLGVRGAGPVGGGVDADGEVVFQRGTLAGDEVDAWAGHYNLGWTVGRFRSRPRLVVEFNHASGDSNPADGRRETFDQLLPTNHAKYGIVDAVGWRNMRDLMLGIEVSPMRKLKVGVDVHRLWLATVADGLYLDSGVRRVLNRAARRRDIGSELDVQTTYTLSKQLSLAAGVGYLLSGGFLDESTGGDTVWSPYLMWQVVF